MSLLISLLLAIGLDYCLGEPKRFHPLVGFGLLANRLAAWLNPFQADGDAPKTSTDKIKLILLGAMVWCLAVLPFVGLGVGLGLCLSIALAGLDGPTSLMLWLEGIFGGLVLYWALGWRSLLDHAQAIVTPLKQQDIAKARIKVGYIVSRDMAQADAQDIACAATESVLENGADAVFAPLFWFLVGGVPGVILYRLSNTLDAMWGYKNERFLYFGKVAARVDDVLNFIPARLTALSYVMVGQTGLAWRSWRAHGAQWKSPNAGPVMAAGAGAIGVRLGGAATYSGTTQMRPDLGLGAVPTVASISHACQLVNRGLGVWVMALVLLVISWFILGENSV